MTYYNLEGLTMRKVKKSLVFSVLAGALVLSACLVYGYGNEAHGSIEEVETKVQRTL